MLTKPLAARFDDSQSSPRKPILRATGEGARTPVTIKMDVTETENGYLVHSEMPGVKKEDIDVAIEGNLVTITAEVGISHDGFPLQPHVSRPVLALQDQRL
jgi:HSP20 family molecular chaperone IbpA